MTHHSVMKSSLLIKILKIDKFGDFSSVSILTLRWTYLEMLSPLELTNVISGDRREPPADKMSTSRAKCPPKCPPAAQGKQVNRACLYY